MLTRDFGNATRYARNAAFPPGPTAPAWLQALRLQRDPVGVLQAWARRYGDTFTLSLPAVGNIVVVAEPGTVRELFSGDPTVYRAGAATARLLPFLGPGSILLADGEEHFRRFRRLLNVFHGEALADHAVAIAEIAKSESGTWPVGRPTPILPSVRAITVRVIARIVLGMVDRPLVDELHARLDRMLTGASIFASHPWPAPSLKPRGPWAILEQRVRAVDELLLAEIRQRRQAHSPEIASLRDALSVLIADAADIPTPSDRALCDELRSLLIAGYETTTAALAWALLELAHDADLTERLHEELTRGDRKLLKAVIDETLRLRTPIIDTVRLIAEPVALGGFILPAETIVMAALPLVHRRADICAQPNSFQPARFLSGRPEPYSFVPFGRGSRRCLGASLATLELNVALPITLARFRLRASGREPERAKLLGTTLVPARDGQITLEARRGIPVEAR